MGRVWRLIRISILLAILAFVALGALVDRWHTTDWDRTLWVGVFPVNADGRDSTAAYLSQLETADFRDVEAFFAREAEAWGVALERPVHVELYPAVDEPPPVLEHGASLPRRMLWSLQARFYSWRVAGDKLARVRVFMLFHDPDHTFEVPHSLGLQKGLLGIVHAYADPAYDRTNNVVLAHELLHTLGATDKYDPATSQPLFPQGYAEPDATPLYPQRFAEIMAGRIAVSEDEAEMPASLAQAVVGPETAREINWIRRP
jgi:hypothetical protein